MHPPCLRRLVGRSDISVDGVSPSTVERPTTLHYRNRNARCVPRIHEVTLHDGNAVPNRAEMCNHGFFLPHIRSVLAYFLLTYGVRWPRFVPSRFGALPTSLEYQPHELCLVSVSGTSFDQTKTIGLAPCPSTLFLILGIGLVSRIGCSPHLSQFQHFAPSRIESVRPPGLEHAAAEHRHDHFTKSHHTCE